MLGFDKKEHVENHVDHQNDSVNPQTVKILSEKDISDEQAKFFSENILVESSKGKYECSWHKSKEFHVFLRSNLDDPNRHKKKKKDRDRDRDGKFHNVPSPFPWTNQVFRVSGKKEKPAENREKSKKSKKDKNRDRERDQNQKKSKETGEKRKEAIKEQQPVVSSTTQTITSPKPDPSSPPKLEVVSTSKEEVISSSSKIGFLSPGRSRFNATFNKRGNHNISE